jgi:hypothetical protein
MIVGGKSHSGRGLGAYLMNGKNEKAEVWELQSGRQDLTKAIGDWKAYAHGTNTEKPLYHAWLRPSDNDRELSREDWNKSIEIFEKEMGLEGQPRAVVFHQGEGKGEQGHIHLVYSRIQDGKAISDSWNYIHHEKVKEGIEKELNLDHVYSPHLDRNEPRRAQGFTHAEMQQGERLKRDPREMKAEVSALYQQAEKNGDVFINSLKENGYEPAQGKQRDYLIVDNMGEYHNLAKYSGVKVAELREVLKDYPAQDLPSVDEARQMQRENLAEVKDLERQAFAADLGVGTLEREPEIKGDIEGKEADAPSLDRGDDIEGIKDLGAGLNAAAEAAMTVLGGLFEGFAGGGKPPPTLEEQKAANIRNERITAAQERKNALEFDYKKQQEEALNQSKGQELSYQKTLK